MHIFLQCNALVCALKLSKLKLEQTKPQLSDLRSLQ